MKDKLYMGCAIVITICFMSIAYSQQQRAKAAGNIAESYSVLAVAEILSLNSSGKSYSLEPGYSQARKLGWSIESSFLYGADSKHANLELIDEINAIRKEEAK